MFKNFKHLKYSKNMGGIIGGQKNPNIIWTDWRYRKTLMKLTPSVASRNHRMVTSSSADVGWIATTLSKSFFVAPIRIATPKPWKL